MIAASACFHCGEPLAGRATLWTRVRDADVAVCCAGCRAAAQLIGQLGLADFYRLRTAPTPKPGPGEDWLAYDEPALLDSLTRLETEGRCATLSIEGLSCPACGWLIARTVQHMDGVLRANVNAATGRAFLVWDDRKTKLSALLGGIAGLGYRPRAVAGDSDEYTQAERRAHLKRLAVAGLGMMQVMMFAVALYVGDRQSMEPSIRTYLRLISLLVATPVMLYAGWPFLRGAAKSLALGGVTMDVPVSVALIVAYVASVINTWRQAGEVYFDSVTMFIFFLTVAKYVEMSARHQSNSVTDALSRLIPATAHRLSRGASGDGGNRGDERPDGEDEQPGGELVSDVGSARLVVGDVLVVRVGENIPADGEILEGCATLDESALTGESLPVIRGPGERVVTGTLNLVAPIRMRVTAIGAATVLAGIVALLERAKAQRPRIIRAADRFASRFLGTVLFGAALVCALWLLFDPAKALPATLAVLVAACPCALSLATLVAVASAHTALARRGVLVANADAVEGLAKVTRVVFDKTGTLTAGRIAITGCTVIGSYSERQVRDIAAALQAASEHPLARAFDTGSRETLRATDLRIEPGAGIEGVVGGRRLRIGTRAFAAAGIKAASGALPTDCDDAAIWLADGGGPLAAFGLQDLPRPESAAVVRALESQGLTAEILSGDSHDAVERVAGLCAIGKFASRQTPGRKLDHVRELTARGEWVAMVGDGVNDAPVLGGAAISIAMGRGSPLAHASADLILIGDSLNALPAAFAIARRARRIIRQNLIWGAAYNLAAMPLAALGWVAPWMAAIGMSVSSIAVALNSMRVRGAVES